MKGVGRGDFSAATFAAALVVATGLRVSVVLWIAPIVQQITHHWENLTAVAQAAGTESSMGMLAALRALEGATRIVPIWVYPLPTGGGLAQCCGVAAWWMVLRGGAWRSW